MDSHQILAVEHHMPQLINALHPTAVLFYSYIESNGIVGTDERELVEKSSILTKDQLLKLLKSLQYKDKGWSAVIGYLRSDGKNRLADQLATTANERLQLNPANLQDADGKSNRSCLKEFSLRLAQYYQLHYANVPTMWEEPKHVKDVWVPLQMDGRRTGHKSADPIDHNMLLDRLRSSQGRNVALIKGDPGMGKTTLAKKIAYDWAVSLGFAKAQQFTLVLAVPLRYAQKSDRFDRLATDYLFSKIDMEGIDKNQLSSDIYQLKSQLLVILDGLDEYGSYIESPFKHMFEAPFQYSSVYNGEQPQMISFKLIITSRPYACEQIQTDVQLLRLAILTLDANHLNNLVRFYCESPEGIAKVTDYLKDNAEFVLRVPLILTFVCFLADCSQEIPTNMTSLYDNLIRQMIRREVQQGKLAEPIDINKWKEGNVVRNTGEVAFWELVENNLEFSSASLKESHVGNDSFICGFLLHKFDFAKNRLMAEFPHRSIQEFFAALYCYHRMLSDRKNELGGIPKCIDCIRDMKHIRKLIVRFDSQFGRFLFGISSLEGQFDQMTNWLNPSLGDSIGGGSFWSLATDINQLGNSLTDCSPHENILMGLILQASVGHLAERVITYIHVLMPCYRLGQLLRLRHFSDEFAGALHLGHLTINAHGDTQDWFMSDDCKSAHYAVVSSRLSMLIEQKFDQINILMWNTSVERKSGMEWKSIFGQIGSLPPVQIFIMSTSKYLASTSVFIRIGYGRMTGAKLTEFLFGYDRKQRKEMLDMVPDEKVVVLTENSKEKYIDCMERSIININVTVDSCESQSALISSLIRMSLLEITDGPSAYMGHQICHNTSCLSCHPPELRRCDLNGLCNAANLNRL